MPFRHFEGNTGCRPVVAMEVFDVPPRNYPPSLRSAYGKLLDDPAAMARYCVEKLGAEAISVRLLGAHPDNGDRSPEEAGSVVKEVLSAVGVPLIVTGPKIHRLLVVKSPATVINGPKLWKASTATVEPASNVLLPFPKSIVVPVAPSN